LFLNLLLLAGCGLLLLGIINIWWGEEEGQAAGHKPPPGLELPRMASLRGQEPIQAFSLVMDKNLFSPDRRGEEDAKPTKGQASIEGSKLMGIIIIGVDKAALISEPARTGRRSYLVVRQGERWGNYQVVEVTIQGVVLQGKEGRKTLDFPE